MTEDTLLEDGDTTTQQDTTTLDTAVAAEAVETQAPVKISEESFLDQVSEDIRGNLNKFKTVDDLAKSYVSLEKKLGGSISIPAEDAAPDTQKAFFDKIKDLPNVVIKPTTEDGLGEFYNKLGRPETANDYSMEDIVPSELLMSDPSVVEELDVFKEKSHELGLNNKQVQGLAKMRMEQSNQYKEEYIRVMEEGQQVLNKTWGNDYDARLSAAKNAKDQLKVKFPEQMETLLATNGNNPALAYLLSEVAYAYQEKGMIGTNKVNFGETPESAREKIIKNQGDAEFKEKYYDQTHPGHGEAMKEMNKLYAIGFN